MTFPIFCKLTLTLYLLTALPTTQASYLEKARKVIAPITHYNKEELIFDYSSIKLLGTIKHLALLYEPSENFPTIARYTLSNGKELWFLLDYHYDPSCTTFADHVITNENFTHGIIENEILGSAFNFNDPFINFTKRLSSKQKLSKNITHDTMGKAYRLLQEQNKIIVSGEFHTPQEALIMYKKEGLSSEQIIHTFATLLQNYQILPTIFQILFTDITIEQFMQWQQSTLSEKSFLNDFSDTLNKALYVRDKKVAQTILEIMHNPTAKKVFIAYGAAHWFTLEKFLEEHFGKPEFFSPTSYKEHLKTKNPTTH